MKKYQVPARIALLFCMFVTSVFILPGCSPESKKEDLKPQAWAFLVQTVTKELGNPNNLSFPQEGASDVTPLGDNRFQITSYADFTNEKGEKEHAYFYGTVIFSNETWSIENLKFSE